MENLLNNSDGGIGIYFLIFLFLLIGAVAKWRLFVKCDQPGIASIVPVWDLVITMNIVGRPKWHAFFFFIPVFNIFFGFKVLIELAQSFGKTSMVDYILVVLLNILYVFNMALAYNEIYHGPVYGQSIDKIKARASQFAH
jgi:signal peptidase I